MAFDHVQREQCVSALIRLILNDQLRVGDRLPGEQALCRRLSATRHLVRLTLSRMTGLGMLERRGRSGTYVKRVPVPGDWVPTPPAAAPVPPGRTLSMMLMGAEVTEQMRTAQEMALQRGYLLHIYLAHPRGLGSHQERLYLELALESGVRGIAIHGTPLQPSNAAVFRRVAGKLRLAHIGYHSEDLPEQSFFLPDYRLAGAMAAGELLRRGCRQVTFASGLPRGHHVNRLLLTGLRTALGCQPEIPLTVLEHCVQETGDGERELMQLSQAGPEEGVVIYSSKVATWLQQMLCRQERPPTERPRCALVCDSAEEPVPPGMSGCKFDSERRMRDALEYLISDKAAMEHRLYLPRYQAAAEK